MRKSRATDKQEFSVVEVCAGAGGQSLGLHKAGFVHRLAVELDGTAADTLRQNLGAPVVVGDVANPDVWNPADFAGVSLFAGGVPCPPFSAAGKQLGTSDERDLFAWAIEQIPVIQPKAVLLENVRGLAAPRFAAYRQRILDRLEEFDFIGEWKLLHASDFGVPQLRPRFVLVALPAADMPYFRWPEPDVKNRVTVGDSLYELMASNGWKHANAWREMANDIGPTLVGGSKKHGGADLGPTRAKQAWAKLGVDGRGVADDVPRADAPAPSVVMPRLTIEMAARIQGWTDEDKYVFSGRKTSQYRQIGNAFPPPVAKAIGERIAAALRHDGEPRADFAGITQLHDPVYRALARSERPLSLEELVEAYNEGSEAAVQQRLAALKRDFELTVVLEDGEERYSLGEFKGFTGQSGHWRHEVVAKFASRVS
ncbi:MAG: DNA (cytosine-5-)-methyltransferase [Actinobacteria bacterium]|nr:DNA (cytosine-5-)-methyltransferase [Actinomycetota bacterium]